MKINSLQIVRISGMILAVAGIIYALEYMNRSFAVWFWVTLLGIGFVGLFVTFRTTQRHLRLESKARALSDNRYNGKEKQAFRKRPFSST